MSRRRSAAQEVPKLEPDEDVEMQDGSSEVDGEGEVESGSRLSREMYQVIGDTATFLCKVEEDGEELAAGFQRIPNRRVLPDYFDVIPHPVAFSTVRSKVLRKGYSSFTEFVRDVTQICHNAQVYNRPSAPIFGAAQRLREIFGEQLKKLVANRKISAEEAQIPDLGEIPEAEDSPPPESGAEDADAADEDDDEEEEEEGEDDDEESDEEGRAPRRRGRRRPSASERKEDPDKEDDAHKKRGRPPSVLTPMEARIHSILRGLRKFKADDTSLLILPFEKLPDKIAVPDYFQTIANPISLDQIKRKAKRKKYANVDAVMVDVDLMFDNAKRYNEDDSPVHEAAERLQKEARVLADQEMAKPDEDFRDDDGKLPLSGINHDGQVWKVGDWIHIRNPNDLAKPIVAQIYRTWQDRDGQRWINACWYYRPEQTVHRYEKHFFQHEVVKTGQYRDHQIEEVVDRCFVMFVTRFPKGRPRGFPADKDVYICESRYNEEKYRFAKIKTWASCVPDEVREKDYEMDMFDMPRKMRKVPSPIKHLLREDAKDSDELPKPTWGSPNAPPIVGAVHRRPREPYESPPPEPTPPPPPTPAISHIPPQAVRRPSSLDISGRAIASPFAGAAPSPSQYNTHMAQHFQPVTPGSGPLHQTPVPLPQAQHHAAQPGHLIRTIPYQPHFQQQHQGQTPQQYQQQAHQQSHQGFNQGFTHLQHGANTTTHGYNQHLGMSQGGRPPMTPQGGSMYNPPRPPEVYTLPDPIQEALPAELREDLQRDQYGRVLFFTAPPLDRTYNGIAPESAALGHSAKYLAGRQEWLAERERKRKQRDEEELNQENAKRLALERSEHEKDSEDAASSVTSQAIGAMGKWLRQFDKDTAQWKNEAGLAEWREPVK